MSLMHAILGFLRRHPKTGYALKNEHFDKSVAYFWPADQTQIYKTLDKLVESGFATIEIEVQAGRPNRKIYSISKTGKEELERWLNEPIELPPYRDPLLVQLFFSEFINPDEIISVLACARASQLNQLAELKSIDLPAVAQCKTREQLAARLTLELGLKSKQAYIDWLDLAITAIGSLETKTGK